MKRIRAVVSVESLDIVVIVHDTLLRCEIGDGLVESALARTTYVIVIGLQIQVSLFSVILETIIIFCHITNYSEYREICGTISVLHRLSHYLRLL